MAEKHHSHTAVEVLEELGRNAQQLRHLGVTRIGLFGSVARGDQSEDSDLDFVVLLREHTFDCYFDTLDYLEGMFGCKVDLIEEEAAHRKLWPYIKDDIRYAQALQY